MALASASLFTAFAGQAAMTEDAPMFMFVQTADDMKADDAAHTLRLVNVARQTIYFSDRPVRLAGHLKMDDYLTEWTKAEGNDKRSSLPSDPYGVTS